jgi:hypothetical protein
MIETKGIRYVSGYSTLMTAVAKMFYLWVETGSRFRSSGIIVDPEELLYVS